MDMMEREKDEARKARNKRRNERVKTEKVYKLACKAPLEKRVNPKHVKKKVN